MYHIAKSLSWKPIKHVHAVPFLTVGERRLPICAMILHTVRQYFPICFVCICLEQQKRLFFLRTPPSIFSTYNGKALHRYLRSFCLFVFLSFYLSISVNFSTYILDHLSASQFILVHLRLAEIILVHLSSYQVIDGRLRSILGLLSSFRVICRMGRMDGIGWLSLVIGYEQ